VPDVAQRFAENLSHYREQAGLTQEELASRAEIHRTQIGALLSGKQLPRLDTIVKLAGALGITPADLVDGITWEPADQRGKFKFSAAKRKK
jgi:transcriptional regulator with XRE-family HTH domain